MATPPVPLSLSTDKPSYAPGEAVTLTVTGVASASEVVTVTAVAGSQAGSTSYLVQSAPVTVSDNRKGAWALQANGTFASIAPASPPSSLPSPPLPLSGAEPTAAQLQAAGISAIEWSGYAWELENWATAPGQPLASEVTVNTAGHLVLSASTVNGLFAGAEADSARGDSALTGNTSLWGYGTYRWVIGTDLSTLAPGLTFGLFTYQSAAKGGPAGHKEIDIEISAPTGNTEVIQFGYYADDATGITAAVPPLHVMTTGSQVPVKPSPVTTLQFTWLPTSITWCVWYGTDTTVAPDVMHIMTEGEAYSYTEVYGGNAFAGTVRIPASGGQQTIMNLWSTNGQALTVNQQVIIESFTFIPA
jgi:hypothetical protein